MQRSQFKYSLDNKRYHTLNYYNMNKYGRKVYKAVLECGFTCPNIDGTKGYGGCIFCDGGSGYFTHPGISVSDQLKAETERIKRKNSEDTPIIAYFQANTNTYADPTKLREIYNEALAFPGVCGLSIGTRADCLSADVIELMRELNERTELTIELGMQTVHESTIKWMNRCCTHEEFVEGYSLLKKYGIRTCLHLINGLPGEDAEMMLETARQTALLHPDAVKIQMLHIISGTKLADEWKKHEISLLSRDEYIEITAHQLELLPADIVIERITGDGDKKKLLAPLWTADKIAVLGGIDKKLADLDTWQGKMCNFQQFMNHGNSI